jgi:membrane protease YdiL (CAAX protease family)
VFLALVFGVGWPVLCVPLLADRGLLRTGPLPAELFALAVTWCVMLPAALAVTAAAGGTGAVRDLLRPLLRWRFGLRWWLALLLALPVSTLLVGLALGGSLGTGGSTGLARGALLLVTAALLIHLCEETVWAGFVQERLERRHHVVVAALLTAVPFAGLHVPIILIGQPRVLPALGGVLALAVGMRLLVGVFVRGTGGSLLTAGLVHAVYNACNNRGALVDGLLEDADQNLAAPIALVLVTAVVAAILGGRLGPAHRPGAA